MRPRLPTRSNRSLSRNQCEGVSITLVRAAEIPRDSLMSWDQLRDVARSGLVDIAVQSSDRDATLKEDLAAIRRRVALLGAHPAPGLERMLERGVHRVS